MSFKRDVKDSPLTPLGGKPLQRLGDYTLIAELARGGMGRVYLARRVGEAGFERLYAIKVMHEHMMDDPEAVLMLLDEANIASQLHHPNVVPITDICTYDNGYFLVMDYVEGSSFYQLLARNRMTRHARLIVPVVIDALRGLHAAHELSDDQGRPLELVHRDFSPHNLMLGIDGICRVTDFGVAKARARFTQTESRMQKGKLAYMAPEQLAADLELDRRVDLWAAGVVLWYALTGQHPFKGKSEALTIRNIISKKVPAPSTVGLRPQSCLDEICLTALARDREGRFESAEEMANELQRVAIQNDLLAPASQVGAWVNASFRYELEARRKTIRAIKSDGDISWISLPVMPHMSSTPSTGGKDVSSVVVHVPMLPSELPEGRLADGLARERKDGGSPLPGDPRADDDSWGDVAEADAGSGRPQEGTPSTKPDRPTATDHERPSAAVEPPSRRRWIPFAAVFAVVLSLCVVAFVAGRASSDEEAPRPERGGPATATMAAEESDEGDDDAPPPEARAPAEEVAPPAESEAEPSPTARVTLVGAPEGASLLVDGLPVSVDTATVPLDGREHVLRVDAEGYRQWMHIFTPSGDTRIEVEMTRPHHRRGRRPDERPHPVGVVRDPGF